MADRHSMNRAWRSIFLISGLYAALQSIFIAWAFPSIWL